jgi:hypothetical protein
MGCGERVSRGTTQERGPGRKAVLFGGLFGVFHPILILVSVEIRSIDSRLILVI